MPVKSRLFAAPRLTGARYSAATIPVDVLPELAVYEQIVRVFAKAIYKARTGKKNVPPGFDEQFSLELQEIKDGSAWPQLIRRYEAPEYIPGVLDGRLDNDEFDEGNKAFVHAIDQFEQTGSFPEDLPPKALMLLKVFGRHLEDGEAIELRPRVNGHPAVRFTSETRRRVATIAPSNYADGVDVTGAIIGGITSSHYIFYLDTEEYGSINVPYASYLHPVIANAWRDNDFTRVRVVGTGNFDPKGKLRDFEGLPHVTLVHTLNVDDVNRMDARLKEFESLEHGWLDGEEGEVCSAEELAWLRAILIGTMASYRLPPPRLFPIPEGGVQADWRFGSWSLSAEFNLQSKSVHLHAGHVKTGQYEVKDIDFGEDEEPAKQKLAGWVLGFQQREGQE